MVCTRMQAGPTYVGCTPLVCCFRQRSLYLLNVYNALRQSTEVDSVVYLVDSIADICSGVKFSAVDGWMVSLAATTVLEQPR